MLRTSSLSCLSVALLLVISPGASSQNLDSGKPHSIATLRLGPSNYGRVQLGLFIANRDGSAERPLLGEVNNDYSPAWSPDDNWIVFTSERAGGAELYRIRPDGSNLERITETAA